MRRATALTFALFLVGCPGAHEIDAGRSRIFDAGPLLDAADPCVIGGRWLRCRDDCEGRCPALFRCDQSAGVCLPGSAVNGCEFVTGVRVEPGGTSVEAVAQCPDDTACWFEGVDAPQDGTPGRCLPEDLCTLAALAPHRCFWPDGTEVLAPLRTPCPDWEDAPHIHGFPIACGQNDCPVFDRELNYCFGATHTPCAGRADSRSFGICSPFDRLCNEDKMEAVGFCASWGQPPCACMMSATQGPFTIEPFGHVVPLEACERYAEMFPGEIRCLTPP